MSGCNAVILAAGRSSKFFPPLYDRPKGLFTYKGEVLIERQIRQLVDAGCREVWVVVGYEKERFFYLDAIPQVRLAVNSRWADEGNVASLACAKEAFAGGGAWLCCADHWYESNPFTGLAPSRSSRMVGHRANGIGEFVALMCDGGRIVGIDHASPAGPCMVGAAWLTADFIEGLLAAYAHDRGGIGARSLFWEQLWARHADELPLHAMAEPKGFREFDSLGDLVGEDPAALDNVSHEATANICRLLGCERPDIEGIEPLNRGLTNVSFTFLVRGTRYVYRQPGWSSGNLVDRRAEMVAQNTAKELGIDTSVLAIGEDGWKLSRYIEAGHAFDYGDACELSAGIDQIRMMHESGATCDHVVDPLAEGDRLVRLASSLKGDLEKRLAGRRAQLQRLWHHVALDGVEKVLCHNDTYAVNWICGTDGLCLIDWEYAGMNDPYNDLAALVVRDGLPRAKYDEIVGMYLRRRPDARELRHAYGVAALCAWYWMGWCLFKDTLGEDGYFMLNAWRALGHYLPLALSMYEGGEARAACVGADGGAGDDGMPGEGGAR